MTDTDEKTLSVLNGSCVFAEPFVREDSLMAWEKSRRFIVEALHGDGTIVDYGCANGYLLRCLQEWSGSRLEPFGVDNHPGRLNQARAMFPSLAHHFLDPAELTESRIFDYVYWAVGDNVDFERQENQNWLALVRGHTAPGGRFIMGFYDTPEANQRKLTVLRARGTAFDAVLDNPAGSGEMIAWVDC